MFSYLSADISLYIISFLPIQDICNLYLLARHTSQFLVSHEDVVYHQLSVTHRFVSLGTSLQDVGSSEDGVKGDWIGAERSWKKLYIRQLTLQRNWSGRGTVTESICDVHIPGNGSGQSFRVDDTEKTIIIAQRTGRLTVYAMEDYRELFSIHTEGPLYDPLISAEFLMICTWNPPSLEIWRRSATASDDQIHEVEGVPVRTPVPSPTMAPSHSQLARVSRSSEDGSLRGQYTPHACIQPKIPFGGKLIFRVYRLCFPLVLLVRNDEPYSLYCYDIALGTQLRTIKLADVRSLGLRSTLPFSLPVHPAMTDVNISKSHIVWCFDCVLVVIDVSELMKGNLAVAFMNEKDSPDILKQVALQIVTPDPPAHEDWKRNWRTGTHVESISMPGRVAMERLQIVPPKAEAVNAANQALVVHGVARLPSSFFVSARISSDGRHLACVSGLGLLNVYPDFGRVSRGVATADEIVQRLHFEEPILDINWGDDPRRLVLVTSFGKVFTFEFIPSYHLPHSDRVEDPDSIILKNALLHRMLHWKLEYGVHVAMTHTRLYARCNKVALRERIESGDYPKFKTRIGDEDAMRDPGSDRETALCFVDFLPSLEF